MMPIPVTGGFPPVLDLTIHGFFPDLWLVLAVLVTATPMVLAALAFLREGAGSASSVLRALAAIALGEVRRARVRRSLGAPHARGGSLR